MQYSAQRLLVAAFALLMVPFLLANNSCKPHKNEQVSTSGAEQAKPSIVPKNSRGLTVEQQQIYDRIKVTTNPAKVMWIHLIALNGKIVSRMAVRSKVTSSGKRLEPKRAANAGGFYPDAPFKIPGSTSFWETNEFIQPDGTYGDSDDYIYWFDPIDRYHQWGTAGGLGYLLTDYPIDLKNPMDEITGMFNASKAASEWQAQQEEELRQHEAKLASE